MSSTAKILRPDNRPWVSAGGAVVFSLIFLILSWMKKGVYASPSLPVPWFTALALVLYAVPAVLMSIYYFRTGRRKGRRSRLRAGRGVLFALALVWILVACCGLVYGYAHITQEIDDSIDAYMYPGSELYLIILSVACFSFMLGALADAGLQMTKIGKDESDRKAIPILLLLALLLCVAVLSGFWMVLLFELPILVGTLVGPVMIKPFRWIAYVFGYASLLIFLYLAPYKAYLETTGWHETEVGDLSYAVAMGLLMIEIYFVPACIAVLVISSIYYLVQHLVERWKSRHLA